MICGACGAEGDTWWEAGEVNRGMKKILMGFSGMRFFVQLVLRDLFGGKLEKSTGGWRELERSLGKWDLWCMWC